MFVLKVLQKWTSTVGGLAVPCTWENLIKCMKMAGLDPQMIQIIEENTIGEHDNIHHSMVHVCN